jgi:DNA-binding transcriptional LysR family regulator
MPSQPLPHLETFAVAAEHGSFTAAAAVLGLTQGAVSQRIHALEQELGTSLFQRHGGRAQLTEAGQRLYPFAQRILALHEEARGEVTGCKPVVAGELFLAASSVPGEHLLPKLLSVFRQRYPHVQVRASISDSGSVLSQIEHGQVHFGLVGGKTDAPHLEFEPFAVDEMRLVVPATHPWGRRRQVSLAELGQQPLILRETGSGSRWCLEQALARHGKSPADLRIALELGSNEAIKEAVLQGLGAAILSTHAVEDEERSGQLHLLAIAQMPLRREMFIVRDRRRALPIPAQLFLDCVRSKSPA